MSRWGKMGKHKTGTGGLGSVIGTIRPAAPKLLTQREQEREAALRHEPGYISYADFLADCRQHLADPIIVGTGLKGAHYTVNEDPRLVTSSGCYDSVW